MLALEIAGLVTCVITSHGSRAVSVHTQASREFPAVESTTARAVSLSSLPDVAMALNFSSLEPNQITEQVSRPMFRWSFGLNNLVEGASDKSTI